MTSGSKTFIILKLLTILAFNVYFIILCSNTATPPKESSNSSVVFTIYERIGKRTSQDRLANTNKGFDH